MTFNSWVGNLKIRSLLFFLISLVSVFLPQPCDAEWEFNGQSNIFYTNDVALFSATRRLTRHQDPTQPVLDGALAKQGDDVIYEPIGYYQLKSKLAAFLP